MKLSNIMVSESVLTEEQQERTVEEAVEAFNYVNDLLDEIDLIKSALKEGSSYSVHALPAIEKTIEEMKCELDADAIAELEAIVEKVDRQFRRYGNNLLRQYRCTSGDKAGRMVTSPEKCGIRKDPRRVRIGKRASRVKKGQRIRKSLFTKRKSQSKRLSRLNKVLRGDK